MAHFIAYMKGGRGEVSRTGTKNSGIDTRAQGWNIGGRVAVEHDSMQERDVVHLWITRGSDGGRSGDSSFYLGAFAWEDGVMTQILVGNTFPLKDESHARLAGTGNEHDEQDNICHLCDDHKPCDCDE